TRPICSAMAATTRKLPPKSENSDHNGANRCASATASFGRDSWAALVIASAGLGRVPPITEYHASQPAFSPVAADGSPDTPIVMCFGRTRRIADTCSRAALGSEGTAGILIEAIP